MKDEDETKERLIQELLELRQRVAELEGSEMKPKQAEEELQKQTQNLGERLKELNCLYGISALIEKPSISLEETLQGTVDLLPPAWQYPEIACARTIFEGQEFRTKNFRESSWKQACDIFVHGEQVGILELFYLEERPEADEGSFLREERNLIDAIAGRLGNITECKRAEENVRRLGSGVEQSIDGMAIGDLEPKLLYVNRAFARMHGYSPEEMIGMKVVNLHNEEQMDQYERRINQTKTQGSWIGEIEHIRKDSTSFPTYMSVTLLKDEKGKPTGIVAVCRDISERKEAEKVLRKREAELEIRTNSLEEVNTALRVLLKRRDDDKKELEEKVLVNMKQLVVPFLEKLEKSRLDRQQMAYLNILESNLNAIVSPFVHTLSAKYASLTRTEIQVANLIKEGKNTKEIGEVMTLSPRTIETHRKNMRKKLGIEKKGNLRSHLLTLQ